MKKISLVFILAVFAVLGMVAARNLGSNQTVTPSRNIVTRSVNIGTAIDEIEVSRVKLIVNIGQPDGMAKVSAPDNLIDQLKFDTDGDELKIRFPSINIKGDARTTVELTVADISEIDASLSAAVTVNGNVRANGKLELSASTSATVSAGTVSAATCDIEASTSGCVTVQNLTVNGKTEIEASTSGSAKIGNLTSGSAEAEANTSGTIAANVVSARSAELEANTSGSIDFKGAAVPTGSAKASTSGSIRCKIASPTSLRSSTGGSVSNDL